MLGSKFLLAVFGMSYSLLGLAEDVVATKAQPTFFENMIPFLLIFVLMYFLMIRPQVKKAKEHTNLLKGLQVGDEVVTSGGIIGRIRSVSDIFVILDLGSTTAKVLKENIIRTSNPKATAAKVSGSKDDK